MGARRKKEEKVRTELSVDNDHEFFPLALLDDLLCHKPFEALSELALLHRGDIFDYGRG
jgi:hypothetical protein